MVNGERVGAVEDSNANPHERAFHPEIIAEKLCAS
jgi:hypothetical protein